MLRNVILVAVLLVALNPSVSGQLLQPFPGEITLDAVTGQVGPGQIGVGQIVMQLRAAYNGPGGTYAAASNSFMLYSDDPATITAITATRLPAWTGIFSNTYQKEFVRLATDDTWTMLTAYPYVPTPPFDIATPGQLAGFGFVGIDFLGLGMPAGFNAVVWEIQFTTSATDHGREICLDKADPEIHAWEWASWGTWGPPGWDGPHCFTITAPDNTPASVPPGTPVPVAVSGSLTATFDNVIADGYTSVTTQTGGPAPPDGYQIIPESGQPLFYDIETTASYSGNITVCFSYDETQITGSESDLTLWHWTGSPAVSTNITTSVDTDANIICGVTSSLSLFALVEPIPPQTVAGRVVADCPAPLTGLLGVSVDAFASGTGLLAGSALTDIDGYYEIADLPAGGYTISLVTPLGYTAVTEEILVEEQAGQTITADFTLNCVDITANPRGIGFWKHQVGVAVGGKGNAQIDGQSLCAYLDLIESHFNSNQINQVVVYNPPTSGICADKLLAAKELLNLKGNVGTTARARQQLTALLLNVAAAYIGQTEVISEDGAVVSQAITYCDGLIDDPEGDHEAAKTICDVINNNRQVAAGVIPLSTDNIAYKQMPTTYGLAQNYPNPFNPVTRIDFSLPQASDVRIDVFNQIGQRVATLVADHQAAGNHTITWNGIDFASGVYLYRLTAGDFVETRKMVLLK